MALDHPVDHPDDQPGESRSGAWHLQPWPGRGRPKGRQMEQPPWWQRGVIYQIYPRSWMDSDGDGVGDLPGLLVRLHHLTWLGVDAVWISPVYPSPDADLGYDVVDYTAIDPVFGTMEDMDRLIAAAHERGLRVPLDWVPNHTSDQHPWFLASRASPDNSKRDWYVWRDPAPGGGPPTNWVGYAGQSAWCWDEVTGQCSYRFFLDAQPDINWRNPEVQSAMLETLRFWLGRGVDGFRIDVLSQLVEDDQLDRNAVAAAGGSGRERGRPARRPRLDAHPPPPPAPPAPGRARPGCRRLRAGPGRRRRAHLPAHRRRRALAGGPEPRPGAPGAWTSPCAGGSSWPRPRTATASGSRAAWTWPATRAWWSGWTDRRRGWLLRPRRRTARADGAMRASWRRADQVACRGHARRRRTVGPWPMRRPRSRGAVSWCQVVTCAHRMTTGTGSSRS